MGQFVIIWPLGSYHPNFSVFLFLGYLIVTILTKLYYYVSKKVSKWGRHPPDQIKSVQKWQEVIQLELWILVWVIQQFFFQNFDLNPFLFCQFLNFWCTIDDPGLLFHYHHSKNIGLLLHGIKMWHLCNSWKNSKRYIY